MAYGLRHLDINGRRVQVGDRVRVFGGIVSQGPRVEDIKQGRQSLDNAYDVLLVEGPCPGSRSTSEGQGTLLLAGDPGRGGNFVVQAQFVEVI